MEQKKTDEFDLELETDNVSAEELAGWCYGAHTCNDWAFSYVENVNSNAVVKDSEWRGGDHCFVYDPDLDVTIDATCQQFDDCPDAGAWDGETHPYQHERAEEWEWTDRDAFEAHWSEHPNSPYYI
jgi:hypothetical protein